MKISVITPTIRPEGLSLVHNALKRQTFKDFEWIVIAPKELHKEISSGEFEIDKLLPDPPKTDDLSWTLNRAYNEAIRASEGELIVSWQDYASAKPDALERFWTHYEQEPKTIVTGVGDKYTQVEPYPLMRLWKDPRKTDEYGTYYECHFNDIEGNFCSVPKQAFYDIGGFDEYLDKFYGMDFYGVLDRLNDTGAYNFKIDQTIESFSLEHDRPEDWEERNAIHGPYNERKNKLKFITKWPILTYL